MATEYIGGCSKEENKDKNNLYKLKSKLLHNKFYMSIKNDYNIIKDLKFSIKKLKEIDTIYSRSDVEYNKFNSTSFPAFLWQREILYKYNFFGIIVGIIDGNIDETLRKIEWHKKFNDIKRLKLVELKKEMLETKRNEVLQDLENSLTLSDPEILFQTLSTFPSYKNFTKCYENISEDNYNLNLQIELVNSYNRGYSHCSLFYNENDFNSLLDVYNNELNKLTEHKNTNVSYVKKLINNK